MSSEKDDDSFADCPPELLAAHDRSSNHRAEVLDSEQCGCFYCLQLFAPSEIGEWTDEDESGMGQTAICPRCGIDSVVGSKSGVDLSPEFLNRMCEYWFS